MKKFLIIIAHPSQKSFSYSLFQEITWFCRANQFPYQTIDLYREDFDPIIRDNEPLINKKMIDNYQSMIVESDIIIFLSPIWWARCATMLEGFFDKVFLQGFAFDSGSSISLKPLLHNKKVLCFLPLGSSHWLKRLVQKVISYARLKFGVLNACFGGNSYIHFCDTSKKLNNDITFEKDKVISIIRKKF